MNFDLLQNFSILEIFQEMPAHFFGFLFAQPVQRLRKEPLLLIVFHSVVESFIQCSPIYLFFPMPPKIVQISNTPVTVVYFPERKVI